ncbi:MAG: peptidase U32 family protein [Candidatus Gracilibacteria bacterium]
MKKIEIMAPVGSFEALGAAIEAGCNSVYFGVQQLNMRTRAAHNFTLEELVEVAQRCKDAGIRSYITLNVLLYEHDMSMMRQIIDTAKKAGISAIIVQDMAAIQYAREINMPIQASTQLSISNFETVKFYAQFADTIVLARELDLSMMKRICDGIEKEQIRGPSGELVRVEVFVHGALCIAQSGRCHMSLLQNNTSAQRGACLQECRRKYRIIDDETGKEMTVDNEYVMSPKDLCALPFIDKLIETGVSVLKIEGRGRSPLYVSTVVRVYREAADAVLDGTFSQEKVDEWMKRLEKVYNRGFTDGYYLGRKLPEWSGDPGNHATHERIFVGNVVHYYPRVGVAEIEVQATNLEKGEEYAIMGKITGVLEDTVNEMKVEDAPVEKAKQGDVLTIPVRRLVHRNDKMYVIRKRSTRVA